MILSQDLDYLFGEGHRRYLVTSTYERPEGKYLDCTHFHDEIENAEKHFNNEIETRDDLHSGSLSVVINDTDGTPFSLNSGFTSLLEAVADITQIAAGKEFYSGDSRQDIQLFIQWAIEFEKMHLGVKWGQDEKMPNGSKFPYSDDYMEAIEKYTEEQIFIVSKEDQ